MTIPLTTRTTTRTTTRRHLLTAAGAAAAAPAFLLRGQTEDWNPRGLSRNILAKTQGITTALFNFLTAGPPKDPGPIEIGLTAIDLFFGHLEDAGFHRHIETHWSRYATPAPARFLEQVPGLRMTAHQRMLLASWAGQARPSIQNWRHHLEAATDSLTILANLVRTPYTKAVWRSSQHGHLYLIQACDPKAVVPCPSDIQSTAAAAGAAGGAIAAVGTMVGSGTGAVAVETAAFLTGIGAIFAVTAGLLLIAAWAISTYGRSSGATSSTAGDLYE